MELHEGLSSGRYVLFTDTKYVANEIKIHDNPFHQSKPLPMGELQYHARN